MKVQSNQRHINHIYIIDILIIALNPISTGPKNTVPKSCLLPIVMALPPSLTVVNIVILND